MAGQSIEIKSEQETIALGARLAEVLKPGAVISLIGPLGAGKTRLVQAIATALGATEEITSPTFVLVNEYLSGRLPIYHFDAYRLRDDDEFVELGPEEYFVGHARGGPGLTFVEWGDRVENCLPPDAITLHIEVLDGERRRILLQGLSI